MFETETKEAVSLQYQVTATGQVVNVKTAKGVPYTIKTRQTTERRPSYNRAADKWGWLKALIKQQPVDMTVIYEGFPTYAELRLARNAAAKWQKDEKFKQSLGHKLSLSVDKENLALWVYVGGTE